MDFLIFSHRVFKNAIIKRTSKNIFSKPARMPRRLGSSQGKGRNKAVKIPKGKNENISLQVLSSSPSKWATANSVARLTARPFPRRLITLSKWAVRSPTFHLAARVFMPMALSLVGGSLKRPPSAA